MTGKDTFADLAPLGLMGFGMTTVLLSMHNAGFFPMGSMILAMGIFSGGMAQVVAGVLEYKKGNTFGVMAFSSYGLFWLSLVAVIVTPNIIPGVSAPDSTAMASYLFMWGLFTFLMFISTLKRPTAFQFVFITLSILLWLLALGDFTGDAVITRIAGYEGILCGFSAFHLAMALVINDTYGGTVLPIGHPLIK
jgi:hypothetical protein